MFAKFRQLPVLAQVIIILLIDALVGEIAISHIAAHFLSGTLGITVYKLLVLALILALNAFLLHQHIAIGRLQWVTAIILLVILLAETGLAVHHITLRHYGYAVLIGVLAAITEEPLFRGMAFGALLQHWQGKHRVRNAVLVSSLFFSLFHLVNLANQNLAGTVNQMIQVFGMGILLAALYVRSGTLLAPMALHFFVDFSGVLLHHGGVLHNASFSVTTMSVAIIFCLIYAGIGLWVIKAKPAAHRNQLLAKLQQSGIPEDAHDSQN